MAKVKILKKEHFDALDAYGDEAFAWANEMWAIIGSDMLENEKVDKDLVSIAFAKIFYDFIYTSMNYGYDSFEWHLEDFYEKENVIKEIDAMFDYIEKIYNHLKNYYGDGYVDKIYESLESNITFLTENGDRHLPSDYRGEDVFTFVNNGFLL